MQPVRLSVSLNLADCQARCESLTRQLLCGRWASAALDLETIMRKEQRFVGRGDRVPRWGIVLEARVHVERSHVKHV